MIRIITSLVTIFTVGFLNAQTTSDGVPKLVVGIAVDQLRGDYLEHFKKSFGENGFKRLLSSGVVYSDIDYPFANVNRASAIATVYTGTVPSVHSITSTNVFFPFSDRSEFIFNDDRFLGNYTKDKYSPKALIGNTISDELKIASSGNSDVCSLAPHPEEALTMAGHRGNGAYWIDNNSGKWCSSTYYKVFSSVLDQENRKSEGYTASILSAQWQPLNRTITLAFPYTPIQGGFTHSLHGGSGGKQPYFLSKETPFVNEQIRQSAIALINNATLGQRLYPDFLSLTFYAGNFHKAPEYGNEIEDTYIRLDKDIELLLDGIEHKVGLNNALIFLFSTGYYSSKVDIVTQGDDATEFQSDCFYVDRNIALLNMYLMALYGESENWVEKYFDNQIYLNRKLIESKAKNLGEIRRVVADFVKELSGVQTTYTFEQIFKETLDEERALIKNGLYEDRAGDVILQIRPDWLVVEQNSNVKEIRNNDAIVCPIVFYGFNLQPQKVKKVVLATEIASTLAYIMRIRAPSAAAKSTLYELQQ